MHIPDEVRQSAERLNRMRGQSVRQVYPKDGVTGYTNDLMRVANWALQQIASEDAPTAQDAADWVREWGCHVPAENVAQYIESMIQEPREETDA